MYLRESRLLMIGFLVLQKCGICVNSQILNENLRKEVIEVFRNCKLEPVSSNVVTKVKAFIENGADIIGINLSFQNFSEKLDSNFETNSLNLLSWVRTTSRHGRGLLLLRPQYEILSLSTLSLGTEDIVIPLKQTPSQCLTSKNASIVLEALGFFILYDFKTPTFDDNETTSDKMIKETEHVCNLNFRSSNGMAQFYYVCCNKDVNDKINCKELKADKYVTVLFVCIYIVNFIAIAFCPLLIPSRLYRNKFQTTSYEHVLMKPFTISIRKTSDDDNDGNVLPISYFKEMSNFSRTIEHLANDVTYDITLKKIDIAVTVDQLLPSNRVPVGLFESLYAALIDCGIRDKSSIKDCCYSNLLGPCKPCKRTFLWYVILRRLMHFIAYLCIGLIWGIRILFYYQFEETDRNERVKAANSRNLVLPYTGNLTWYLTPVHIVFLVCYCIFLVDFVLFGVLVKHVKNTFKDVLWKCFRDMRDISRTAAVGWSVQILILPFKHCGILGFLFAWLYYIPAIPIVTLTLAFYCLPTINIFFRLTIYFVAYLLPYGRNRLTECCCTQLNRFGHYIYRVFRMEILTQHESIERQKIFSVRNRILLLVVILFCLLTVLSSALIAMECIVFIVELIIYTFIGLIVNAASTLKYISLIFLIVFYARDCFSTVTTEYLTFNRFLNNYLLNIMREKVKKISMKTEQMQKNTAFQVSQDDSTGGDDKTVTLLIKDETLRWETHRLILFLDKNDTPFIDSNFFFDACYLEHAGVPGRLLTSLLRAMRRFLLICVFLFFVVIVILAFGEEYGISATNQLFATLAGGFLPYILKFVLFKQPEPVTVDPENLSFQNKMQRLIDEFTEEWDLADLSVDDMLSEENYKFGKGEAQISSNEKSKEEEIMLNEVNPTIESDNDLKASDICLKTTFECQTDNVTETLVEDSSIKIKDPNKKADIVIKVNSF